jgi:hypothetical protein
MHNTNIEAGEDEMTTLAPIEPAPASRAMTQNEREFILLVAFVYAQHGQIERAGILLECLYGLGEYTSEVMIGRTVLRFFKRDWAGVLGCLEELDRMDPLERFGDYRLTERQRMRRYLKARSLFELHERTRARDAVEVYMRRGRAEEVRTSSTDIEP